MAAGDIQFLREDNGFGAPGDVLCNVAAGATTINPGEPVVQALGAATVTAMATSKPVVGTDYLVGIATTTSTQTAGAAGTVSVSPLDTSVTYLIAPAVAATWDTQSEYDALVGDRVVLQLSGGSYTILATDGATNGCVIQPLDISKYPGKVAFKFRAGCNYLA